jgi:spore coat protein CotH
MWFYNGIVNESLPIGIRLHGSLSRSFLKKSWKISFEGDKIYQIKGFYLKGATLDPSYAREILSTAITYRYKILTNYLQLISMNSPVARLSFGTLYINDIFFGMYLLIEDNNDAFLKSRFGNDGGALYKCCGDFTYLGKDPQLYMNATCGDILAYDPKTVSSSIILYSRL